MKNLYIVSEGEGEGVYNLVADDGECLASHFCSSKEYAKGDLEANRPERQKKWKEKYGEYQVLYLGDDDMTKEELINLNKKWYKSLSEKEK